LLCLNIREISLSSNGGLFVLFHSSNAANSIWSVSPDCFKCAATLIPAWSLSPSPVPVIILLMQILVLTLRASHLWLFACLKARGTLLSNFLTHCTLCLFLNVQKAVSLYFLFLQYPVTLLQMDIVQSYIIHFYY